MKYRRYSRGHDSRAPHSACVEHTIAAVVRVTHMVLTQHAIAGRCLLAGSQLSGSALKRRGELLRMAIF